MVLGFKIADGYVEVHANYDRAGLRRAAQQAADDSGKTFSRDFNNTMSKELQKSCTKVFHETLEKCFERHKDVPVRQGRRTANRFGDGLSDETERKHGRFERIGRRMASFLARGLAGPGGAGAAARGFVRNFIEAITFGQADFQRVNTTGLARGFSVLGTTLGAGLAVTLIAELGNAITAGLPLVLGGAFAAIPFFTLIRSGMEKEKGKWHTLNNEMGRELDKIVNRWKIFKVEISKPWKPVVFATLGGLVQLMKDLQVPMTRIGRVIAPAFGNLLQGVFDSITAFVTAVEPAMPGVVAGLNAWARELPRIAAALGDMIAYILKDPQQVSRSVKDFSDFFILVTKIAGPVISFLTDLTHWMSEFARWGGSALHVGANFAIALQKGFANVKPVIDKVVGWFRELPGRIISVLKAGGSTTVFDLLRDAWGKFLPWLKGFVGKIGRSLEVLPGIVKIIWTTIFDLSWEVQRRLIHATEVGLEKIIGFFKNMKTKVVDWVKRMWSEASASFKQRISELQTGVFRFVSQIVGFFSNLRTRVVQWVRTMWNENKQWFTTRSNEIRTGVSQFVNGIVNFFSNLKTRVEQSWRTFWTNMSVRARDTMRSIQTTIGSILGAIDRGISRAVAGIGRTFDRIRGALKKPVGWAIDFIFNGGLIKAFNWIAGVVNKSLIIPTFPRPPGFASGGVLPGYTPGKDVHRFVSATGGVLDLSGGEGIARPELVRHVGTDRWDAANAAAAHGRLTEAQGYLGGFALGSSGGFLGGQRPVPPGWTHQHSGYGWARWAGDLQASMNTAVRAWNAGTIATVRSLSGSYGRHIIENVGGQSVYYAHLARAIVKAGQKVNQGQLIGYSDSTGNSTGPHLHFEIRGGGTAIGGTAGGGGGGGSWGATSLDPSKYLGLIDGALGKLGAIKDTPWGRIVAATATKIAGSVKEKISSMASSFVGAAGAAAAPLNVTGNKAIVRAVAQATHGWGTGAQWNALYSLVMGESGFRNTAQNPTSSAYGLFQFLNSTWGTVGGHKTSDPRLQSIYGMRYIANSYGSPVNAYSKWQSRSPHWYDQGGVLPPGLSLAYNGTGRNEQLAVLPNAALQHASATGQAHGRAFSPTINVTVQAGLNPVDAGARRALVKALWLELDRYEKDYVR